MRRAAAVLTAAALACLLATAPAWAPPPDNGDEGLDQPRHCFRDLKVRGFSANRATIKLGQTSTLNWEVKVPSDCELLLEIFEGREEDPRGSRVVAPRASTRYSLRASFPGQPRRTITTTKVNVVLPKHVTISANNMGALFRQAIGTPDTSVRVQHTVALDLSHLSGIPIAQGVSVTGGRSSRRRGALLYTDTEPRELFILRGNDIDIVGLRIRGANQGVAEGDGNTSSGISLNSTVDIDIQRNEIYGWKNSGVEIRDVEDSMSYVGDPAVRVHDNYIHHNQRVGRLGYGVVVGDGAYALIDRNVFDYNRHAIAGDGSDDSGYRAYDNLVLPNGGKHRRVGGRQFYTHQFDMHGQRSCGIRSIFSDTLYNCGRAGHDMELRYNSFLYTKGNAFELRGTPALRPNGAYVVSNVFAHGDIDDAVHQTESGMYLRNNLVGVNGMSELGSCDFDGGGTEEDFLATGQTWWFRAGGQWWFLNRSAKRRAQLELGRFDNRGGCDVKADGVIYSGGKGEPTPAG